MDILTNIFKIILYFYVFIKLSKQSYEIYVQNGHNLTVFQPLHLNGPCKIQSTGTYGICKLIFDCPLELPYWYARNNPPTLCGYFEENAVLCCPNKEINDNTVKPDKIVEAEFIAFENSCIIKETHEIGTILRKQNCPYKNNSVSQQSDVCLFEICNDLVCCPREQCGDFLSCEFSKIETLLRNRLYLNFECKLNGTQELGVYTFIGDCSYYTDQIAIGIPYQKVCNWEFCNNYVCCPKTNIIETICKSASIPSHEYIEVISGPCTDEITGQQGTCKPQSQCIMSTDVEHPLTKCGKYCRENLVCCPDPIIDFLTQPHEHACAKYLNEIFEDTKIIQGDYQLNVTRPMFPPTSDIEPGVNFESPDGGFGSGVSLEVKARLKEFPHMSSLGYDIDDHIEWNCGGSLISEEFILTAAHCLYYTSPVKYARIGIIDLEQNKFTCDCPTHFIVAERIQHPDYIPTLKYNDIALIKLNHKVTFYSHIRPACLPTTSSIPYHLQTAGFTEYHSFGIKSKILVRIDFELYPNAECNETLKPNYNQYFNGLDDITQFCAGSTHSIIDKCHGDLGGPVQAAHPNFYKMATVYGVTSFGSTCDFQGSPSVITAVFPYISWIEKIIWG